MVRLGGTRRGRDEHQLSNLLCPECHTCCPSDFQAKWPFAVSFGNYESTFLWPWTSLAQWTYHNMDVYSYVFVDMRTYSFWASRLQQQASRTLRPRYGGVLGGRRSRTTCEPNQLNWYSCTPLGLVPQPQSTKDSRKASSCRRRNRQTLCRWESQDRNDQLDD